MKREAIEALVHDNFRALFNRMDIGEELIYKKMRKKNKRLKKEISSLKDETYELRISVLECQHRLSALENDKNQLIHIPGEIQHENL